MSPIIRRMGTKDLKTHFTQFHHFVDTAVWLCTAEFSTLLFVDIMYKYSNLHGQFVQNIM